MIVTGERFVPNKMNLDSEVEHYHRYNILKNVVKDKVVLDAACGTGYGSYFLSDTAKNVYGIDISDEAIYYAKDNYMKKNLQFKKGSVDNLDFPTDYFDIIISYETIEHVDTEMQNKFLKEINRVLKNDGVLIMSTPNKKKFTDERGVVTEFHIKEFYEQEYIDFISSQFKYQKIYNQYFSKSSHLISYDKENLLSLNFDKDRKGMFFIVVASNSDISNIDLNSNYYYPEQYSKCDDFIQIYYSLDNNFNEKESIVSYICRDDKCISINMDMDNVRAQYLRIDPLNTSCEISVKKINVTLSDGKKILIEDYITNSDETEMSKYIFLSIDPQIIINLKKIEEIRNIEIEYTIYKYNIDIYDDLCEVKEKNILLGNKLNEEQLHLQKLEEQSRFTQANMDLLEESVGKMEQLYTEIQNRDMEILDLNDKVKQLGIETNLNIELSNKLKLNEEEAKILNTLIQTYANSRSWRMTSGLRLVAKGVKKISNKILKVKKKYENVNSLIAMERVEESVDKRKIVLIISHTDYLNSLGGTEKYIFEQVQSFKDEDKVCFQIFPMQHNHFLEQGDALYGVNLEEKMIGSFNVEHINKIIEKNIENIEVVYIHHLIYWKNEDVVRVINQLKQANTKIVVYIHDCFSCCPSIYNVYTKGEPLGDCILSSNNIDLNVCSSCKYKSEVEIWRSRFKFVFENADVIVLPSEFMSLIFNKIYEGYKEKIIVQGHLKLINPTKVKEKKIRIAYLGYKSEFKGWNTWKAIYENEKLNSLYEFYHIGSQEQYAGNVKCFSYSFIQEGLMGAVELLNANQIDIVLLWSTLPESYSYTLYESIAAGIPILTNKKSGNIAYTISKSEDKMGKVFENEKDLMSFLSDYKQVANIINHPRYRYELQYNPNK